MLKKIYLISAMVFVCAVVFAQEQDLKKFIPPQGELKDTHTMQFAGYTINSALFFSPTAMPETEMYYADYLARLGYNKVSESINAGKRLVEYKNNQDVVRIAVKPAKDMNGTQVTVSCYVQPEGKPNPEKAKPSFGDLFNLAEIKEEANGKDCDFIPRPPESIRVVSLAMMGTSYYFYLSKQPIETVSGFYQNLAEDKKWETAKTQLLDERLNEYKKETGKDNFGVILPFSDITINSLAQGGVLVKVSDSDYGEAEITVLNKPGNGQYSTMIMIRTTDKKKE